MEIPNPITLWKELEPKTKRVCVISLLSFTGLVLVVFIIAVATSGNMGKLLELLFSLSKE